MTRQLEKFLLYLQLELRKKFACLIGQELVQHVEYFKKFSNLVNQVITHKYSREMDQKSIVVSNISCFN